MHITNLLFGIILLNALSMTKSPRLHLNNICIIKVTSVHLCSLDILIPCKHIAYIEKSSLIFKFKPSNK